MRNWIKTVLTLSCVLIVSSCGSSPPPTATTPAVVGVATPARTSGLPDATLVTPKTPSGTTPEAVLEPTASPALGPKTGPVKALWKFKTGKIFEPPALNDEMLYVVSSDQKLHALDTATGTERWNMEVISDNTSPPVADSRRVYIVDFPESTSSVLYALDAKSGNELWKVEKPFIYSRIAATSNTVYAVLGDNPETSSLHALDAATGQEQWKAGTYSDVVQLLYVDRTLYINSLSTAEGSSGVGSLIAIDTETHQQKWETVHRGYQSGDLSSLSILDSLIYVSINQVSMQGALIALDSSSGKERWKAEIESPGSFYTAPVAQSGVVYTVAGSQSEGVYSSNVLGLDAKTGKELWKLPLDDTFGDLVVQDGTLYVSGIGNYFLYAIDAKTGKELWRFKAEDSVYFPTPAGNTVYFVASSYLNDAGYVYAVR